MNEANAIHVEHRYTQSPAVVWQALTSPELHAKWWAPGDVRAVVGHTFTLDMGEWGQQRCEVIAVEAERLFKYRYAIGVLDTVLTWRLEPDGDGTKLTMIHDGFDLSTERGRMGLNGMRPGWPKVLGRLAEVLAR